MRRENLPFISFPFSSPKRKFLAVNPQARAQQPPDYSFLNLFFLSRVKFQPFTSRVVKIKSNKLWNSHKEEKFGNYRRVEQQFVVCTSSKEEEEEEEEDNNRKK